MKYLPHGGRTQPESAKRCQVIRSDVKGQTPKIADGLRESDPLRCIEEQPHFRRRPSNSASTSPGSGASKSCG